MTYAVLFSIPQEAKQKLPPFLASLETEYDQFAGNLEIGDCGGIYSINVQVITHNSNFLFLAFGLRITACPKLEAVQNKKAKEAGNREYLADNAADC